MQLERHGWGIHAISTGGRRVSRVTATGRERSNTSSLRQGPGRQFLGDTTRIFAEMSQ